MNSSPPFVSIVIPTFNRADAVVSAVQSALDQEYEPKEVIVVDDGSADDTLERLAKFRGRIQIVRHASNRGAGAARNTGIAAAAGDYVALLDSDDLWLPQKTTRQISFMLQHHMVMSCTGFRAAYAKSTPAVVKNRPYSDRLGVEDLVWGIYVAPGTTLIARRSMLLEIGGYDASLPRLEDWDLLLRAVSATGQLGFVNEDLAILHPSSGVSPGVLLSSANMLLERGAHTLKDQGAGIMRKFHAGVAFEMAAGLWKCGARTRSMAWLARSVMLAPVGHESIRIILFPWLQERLRGLRRGV